MRILVVGRGAREHALVWRLAQSPDVSLFCAPGNAGTADLAESVGITETELPELVRFARHSRIDLAVIGPEAPLALGLTDALEEAGLRVFGPNRSAAEIESSKGFAKALMRQVGVPTAAFERFRDPDAALAYLDQFAAAGATAAVVKADGLAAGKGVIVCDNLEEARQAVQRMMRERVFGTAGDEILIEERLFGEEVSRFDLCDGRTALALPSAQDYKRVFDGDAGPNTGGMGAYAPATQMDTKLDEIVSARVVRPTLDAMANRRRPYRGCLFTGLILTQAGPQVIEFNCRFGDPEAEVLLPLIEGDFAALLLAAAEGRLHEVRLQTRPERAVCVMMASGGYPDSYPTGLPIEGLSEAARLPGVTVFHAGTRREGRQIVTDGGRVLAVTATGSTLEEARSLAYEAVGHIHFEGAQFRRDIAQRALLAA